MAWGHAAARRREATRRVAPGDAPGPLGGRADRDARPWAVARRAERLLDAAAHAVFPSLRGDTGLRDAARSRFGADLMFCEPQFVKLLQIHPELRSCTKPMPEPKRRVAVMPR